MFNIVIEHFIRYSISLQFLLQIYLTTKQIKKISIRKIPLVSIYNTFKGIKTILKFDSKSM